MGGELQNGGHRGLQRPLSVAPMMDRSDRHYRYFMRQITRCTLLYTEMITTAAILHGPRQRLLGFSGIESPLVLQLGGDDPGQLAECARIAEDWGYEEINLNVGCPSDRVQSGHFGACLMAHPELVARGVEAIRRATALPVTVKHRIGIDQLEHYEHLARFVSVVAEAGCDRFIVHARIAVLQGLSPRQNRTVPPLRYADVYRLKQTFPELRIEINGGITNLDQVCEHLHHVDGVMIGRAAYDNPYLFALVDTRYFDDVASLPTRRHIIEAMIPYVERWVASGLAVGHILRHMLGLCAYQRVAKAWKRYLNDAARLAENPAAILPGALRLVPDDILDTRPALPHGDTILHP
ncbi:tRNA-dihydrouridine(20/20a) synthase [Candidatus Entotheonellaceae bacterium PAL068K]